MILHTESRRAQRARSPRCWRAALGKSSSTSTPRTATRLPHDVNSVSYLDDGASGRAQNLAHVAEPIPGPAEQLRRGLADVHRGIVRHSGDRELDSPICSAMVPNVSRWTWRRAAETVSSRRVRLVRLPAPSAHSPPTTGRLREGAKSYGDMDSPRQVDVAFVEVALVQYARFRTRLAWFTTVDPADIRGLATT